MCFQDYIDIESVSFLYLYAKKKDLTELYFFNIVLELIIGNTG